MQKAAYGLPPDEPEPVHGGGEALPIGPPVPTLHLDRARPGRGQLHQGLQQEILLHTDIRHGPCPAGQSQSSMVSSEYVNVPQTIPINNRSSRIISCA